MALIKILKIKMIRLKLIRADEKLNIF